MPNVFMRLLYAWLPALRPVPVTPARARRQRDICPDCGKSIAIIASTQAFWAHHCEPRFDAQAAALADAYRGEDGACIPQAVPSDAGMEGRR